MEQNKNGQAAQSDVVKNTSPEQGREPGNGQQTASEPATDISQVDQQEGDMNHGELGGNLSTGDGTQGA